MKLRLSSFPSRSLRGFTLAELLVGSGIAALVVMGGLAFILFSSRALSGVTTQNVLNQQAGNTLEFMQSRIRFANTISNSASGNTLTLGFDDDPTVDSSGDKVAYNDVDHYERFRFVGTNSTDVTLCATNQLHYYTNTSSTNYRVLISSGVRNLPGYNIFTITNQVIAIIRFGISDKYSGDQYQAVDIQGTGLPLNRGFSTNVITILP
jgi:Tfp pilus assembly protein FimT